MKIDVKILREKLKKRAALIAVGVIGLILILWPSKKTESAKLQSSPADVTEADAGFSIEAEEERIRTLLEEVDGVGKASVRLTASASEETVYLENRKLTADGREESSTTVTVPRGSGSSEAVVVKKLRPELIGCVVACEGADSDSVRLRVVSAVQSLTGLSSDRITVLKSK